MNSAGTVVDFAVSQTANRRKTQQVEKRMFNTLLLLTSSWFVALALRSVRNNWIDKAPRLVCSAILILYLVL